ncbi:acyltransferase [Pseudooceanicola sp. CBS1P-1]|uniref:Acyltransferase family protein n=1 Tax=Pseudooceanicola albus TaxID=2692189 RepID=A0A6L7G6A7_9RHOB|nr:MULTISPECIES: acyltransferase [Pseudooceanicola]MBT9383024.1 acyltransferase [Pseudooceanicola endophyticus]MXN19212.1 acyltransferase family protein [Pseudooceanicola albus]
MNAKQKPRLVWFDANRVCAAFGVILIHATTNFSGQPFTQANPDERVVPVLLRSIGDFSGSEMFFFFSLFLMAMRVDRRRPTYREAILTQAERLLIPFAFWTVFYAFFRLLKAEAFNYAPQYWDRLTELKTWFSYFLLGQSQYHMHFIPTLFIIFLFYPVMRLAMRYPLLGVSLFVTLSIMNQTQAYFYSFQMDPLLRAYLVRIVKIFGYVGYGMAAFALYQLWKEGIPRGEAKLIRRGAIFFAAMAYIAVLPYYGKSVATGLWAVREDWNLYGKLLMPLFMFCIFMGGQYRDWSPAWSKTAKYTFGIYLVHPILIDLYDIFIYSTGLYAHMRPTATVVFRIAFAMPGAYYLTKLIGSLPLLAWTVGLGETPWKVRRQTLAAAASKK